MAYARNTIHIRLLLCFLLSGVRFDAFAEIWYGTAFSIGDGYTYVTNNHVTNGANTLCFRTPSGKAAKAKVINTDKYDDLSILRSNIYSPPLQIGTFQDIKKGMNVLTIGYPVPDIMGLESKVTEGLINSLTGAGGDSRRIQISAPIQPGNSGGPLVDDSGHVVGVVVSRLGKKFADATGQYADSVGYAINVSRLRSLIETTPILPNYIKPSPQKHSIPKTKLVSMIENAVMLVVASNSSENCAEGFDVEIPDFGTLPKTKLQIEREAREIEKIAQIRLEAERKEKIKSQAEADAQNRILALKEQQRIKLERAEQEKTLRLQESIDRTLSEIHHSWKAIEKSPSYGLYKIKVLNGKSISLLNSESSESAKHSYLNYLKYIDEIYLSIGNSIDKYMYSGLTRNGKLIQLNREHSYGIIQLENELNANTEDILIGENGNWNLFKISKSVGNKISFQIDKNSPMPNETAAIYIVNK